MPVIFIVMLLCMWCFPLPAKFQHTLNALLEVAQAWSALEVFAIAIAASLLEIQQFATFIIGSSCDTINAYLEENAGTRLDGDDSCFDVIATLRAPSWTLFLAVFLLIFFCLPLTRLIGSVIEGDDHMNKNTEVPDDLKEDGGDVDDMSVGAQIKMFSDDSSMLEEPLLDILDWEESGEERKRRRSLTFGDRCVKYGAMLYLVESEVATQDDNEAYPRTI